jgi:transposase
MSNSNEELDILGIDISKAKFDVALLKDNGKDKIKSKVFANTPEGFEQLQEWLNSQGVTKLHGCMEATSIYGNALARFLVAAGYTVSIVNPSRPKGEAQVEHLFKTRPSICLRLLLVAITDSSFLRPSVG